MVYIKENIYMIFGFFLQRRQMPLIRGCERDRWYNGAVAYRPYRDLPCGAS